MKWIKRLCSFIFLCVLIAGGILLWQGYREYREALQTKSVEEMARQIESELGQRQAQVLEKMRKAGYLE